MTTTLVSPATPMDPERRTWVLATAAAGGVGTLATAVPFVASIAPSERAKAGGAPVELEDRKSVV